MRKRFLKTLGMSALFIVSTITWSPGQSINIDFIEFAGRNVVVHYTLDDGANSTRQFLVQLYSSQDNFTTPLTRVSGDFGSEVTAGVDKKIVWNITQELGNLDATLSLEIRGRVYVPFVKLNIQEDQVYKRGKNYPVNWTSGNLSGTVNIELYNSQGERIWGENNVPNVGKFDWYLPGSVKKGSNYKLKFTNTRDRNDVVFSHPFSIKPKIPLLVKIGAGVIVCGAAGYFLSTGAHNAAVASQSTPYQDPLSPK